MNTIIWSINPEAFSVGPLSVRWYGLFFALSFLLGYEIMSWVYRCENKPKENLDTLLGYMFLGTIVGARLGHCLFYEPGYYLSHPWEIPAVWHGGLASHGAVIGILLSLYIYSKRHPQEPYLWLLSRMAITVALAGFFIRTGNFFNSEIVGKPTDMPWAIIFRRVDLLPRHPSQLYEALAYLGSFAYVFGHYYRNRKSTNNCYLLGVFFTLVFSFRFLIEFTKEPQAAFEQNLPLDLGQLLSVPVILGGLYLIWKSRRRTGSVESNAYRRISEDLLAGTSKQITSFRFLILNSKIDSAEKN